MAYDESLALRIRRGLASRRDIAEKKMFGGIGFLLNGNMCCGVHGENMIVRLPPEETDAALRQPHTAVFDLTGRPMKGWILVGPDALGTANALEKWMNASVKYALSLPPK